MAIGVWLSGIGLRACLVLLSIGGLAVGNGCGTGAGASSGGAPGADGGSTDAPGNGLDVPSSTLTPGTSVVLTVPATRSAALTQFQMLLAQDAPATADAFLTKWKPSYRTTLGYDPRQATNMDRLQASHLMLNDSELAALAKQGFVISGRQAFPSYFLGYKTIYADDLPVFISADSILHAVHRSYDAILKGIEQEQLTTKLDQLLAGMHAALGAGGGDGFSTTVRADVDLYLTVARDLLQIAPVAPVAGGSAADIQKIVMLATEAQGFDVIALFGDPQRAIDFSQFKPRGHYADDPGMERYFRAMIWLGRTDLRLISQQKFIRRQFEDALLLSLLLDDAGRAIWQQIDDVLRGFVGESDNMTVTDFSRLSAVLGNAPLQDLPKRTDQQLAQAITDTDLGLQRIASQILVVPPQGFDAPLDRTFLLFGQRFVLDSEVLSNVVFDRVLADSEADRRMMPDPLDVAFGALGNTHAAPLLAADLGAHKNYPTALDRARRLADAHEPAFWKGSLYHAWLGTLRALSPAPDLSTALTPALPAVATTEAWSWRLLNTQLASWAELRHDTLLYAKQSYTSVPACEFPDGYVDPYPEVWNALGRYADRGLAIAGMAEPFAGTATNHFTELKATASRLSDMATRELTGQAFTAEQLAWLNQAVTIREVPNCGPPLQIPEGWYVKLFAAASDVTSTDPTIADVHTDPNTMGPEPPGQVLHVGTGGPRLMVMTADTCMGPRAYIGLASSYYEKTTVNFQRLDDKEWSGQVANEPDVSWMKDLVSH